MVENLVVENNLKMIFESLLRTQSNQDFILVWQLETDGRRVVNKAFLKSIKAQHMCLILKSSDGRSLIFDKDLDLYIRCEDRGLLFKGQIQEINADEVKVVLPRSARILENRANSRAIFDKKTDVKSVIEKVDDAIVGKTRFDLNVENINAQGLGVIFSISKLNSFSIGDKVKVCSIGRFKYSIPFECEVVHLTSVKEKAEGMTSRLIKMGLRFSVVVPEETILELIETYVE